MVAQYLLAILLCCDSGSYKPDVLYDVVDAVEINHLYDHKYGDFQFDQIIWYRWNNRESRFDIIAWKLIKDGREKISDDKLRQLKGEQPIVEIQNGTIIRMGVVPKWKGHHIVPTFNPKTNQYESIFYDGKVLRKVVSKTKPYETWTTYDRESERRIEQHQDDREGLLSPEFLKLKKNKWMLKNRTGKNSQRFFGIFRMFKANVSYWPKNYKSLVNTTLPAF